MAHGITRNDTMFSAGGETPWHGLGQVINKKALTAEEAIVAAKLGWEVEKRPLFTSSLGNGDPLIDLSNPEIMPVTGEWAMVRKDTNAILGVCGDRYVPVQNIEGFTFFDAIVSNKEAIYHTAGSLHGGGRVWILAKLPGEIKVIGDDITEKYVLIAMSHDGKSAIVIKTTPIRVVCANTLGWALEANQGAGNYSIRHTATAGEKIAKAAKAMGFINTLYDDLATAYQAMAKVQMNGADTRGYLEACYGLGRGEENRHLNATMELIETGRGSELPGVRGTLWGNYQAVVERIDHKAYRKPDNRLENAWFDGPATAIKDRAFEVAQSLI